MNVQNLSGQKLGQYELRELLGVGGMGAVYVGYQTGLKRKVAVKVLPPSFAAQPGYVERFTREAETAAALEHQNIVPIYDYGTQRGTSYVVMRLLTGGSLDQRLKNAQRDNQPLPSLRDTAEILRQLASALDYAHHRGVIHRDIKASNVMFDNQGSAYLVDFGIARLIESTSSLTGTGLAMGTPSYMAPEQWRVELLTPAADQYALGVLIYMMVSGRMPFDAPTPFGLMHKHLYEMPTPPEAIRSDVPPALTHILERSFAKNPADRFPTVTAFAQAFEAAVPSESKPTSFFVRSVRPEPIAVIGGTPGSVSFPVPKPPNRNLLIGIVAGVLLLTLAAFVFILAQSGANEERFNSTLTALAVAQAATTAPASTSAPIVLLFTETAAPSPTVLTPESTNTDSGLLEVTVEATGTAAAIETLDAALPVSPSATATLTITPLPTNTATDIPTHTDTVTFTPTTTTTNTATPSLAPSATLTQTATVTFVPRLTPVSLSAGVQVTFRDDFNGDALNPINWQWYGNRPPLENGHLILQTGSYAAGLHKNGIRENEGLLLLFQYEGDELEIHLEYGDWDTSAHRRWGIARYNRDGYWLAYSQYGAGGANFTTYETPSIQPGEWYYLLFRVDDNGRMHTRLWRRDDPSHYLLSVSTTLTGTTWDDTAWRFTATGRDASLLLDFYEELRFPAESELPDTPPQQSRAAPTVMPTRTLRPTPTSRPESSVIDGAEVVFRDEFYGVSLSNTWRRYYNGAPLRVADGQLAFAGQNRWGDSIARPGISEGEGVLVLFQYQPGTMELYLDNRQEAGDSYRRWGIGSYSGDWQMTCEGTQFCDMVRHFSLDTGHWYYLLLRVAPEGRFAVQVWDRDNPSQYVLDIQRTLPGASWRNVDWRFTAQVFSGTFRAESYEELRFPADYEAPDTPPQLGGVAVVPTMTPEDTAWEVTWLVVNFQNTTARSGPGTNFELVALLNVGSRFPVIGRTEAGGTRLWYLIMLESGERAWVWGRVVELLPGNAEVDVAATVPVTPTYTPTMTLTPTATAMPTATPTLIALGVIVALNDVNLRTGPSVSFPAEGALASGTELAIIGVDNSNTWYNVRLNSGEEGWVSAVLVRLQPSPIPSSIPTPSNEFVGVEVFPGRSQKVYTTNPQTPNDRTVTPIDIFIHCIGCDVDDYQVTKGDGDYDYPAWSPDGTMIAALRDIENACLNDIVIMSADGSWSRDLANARPLCREIGWSPAGNEIAFSDERGNLMAINIFTEQVRTIVPWNLTNDPNDFADIGGITWSPSGTEIAFWTSFGGDRNDEATWTVWIVQSDGSNLRRFSGEQPGYGHMNPHWTPEGEIVFTRLDASREDIQNWIMRSDGTNLRRVTSTQEILDPFYLNLSRYCSASFYCGSSPWEP